MRDFGEAGMNGHAEGERYELSEATVAHFCRFVEYYTRHSSDPMYTAAVCEQQARAICINSQDVTPETISLLIATMLNAINHLEKKWLDEHLRCEELLHDEMTTPVREHTASDRGRPGWIQGIGNFLKGGFSYAR